MQPQLPFFNQNGFNEEDEGSQYSGGEFSMPLTLQDDTQMQISKIKEFVDIPCDQILSEEEKQLLIVIIRKLIINLKENQAAMKEE